MFFSLFLKQNGKKKLFRKHQNHGFPMVFHGFPIFPMVFSMPRNVVDFLGPRHVQLIRICPRTASGKTPPRRSARAGFSRRGASKKSGKPWEIHRKTIGTPATKWENSGKSWGLVGNHGLIDDKWIMLYNN